MLRELSRDPTILAILDAVTDEQEESQAAAGARTTGENSGTLTSLRSVLVLTNTTAGTGGMSAYRASYEADAAWAERLAQTSGAHGQGGDATRAHAIVNALLTCEAMGGAIFVAAEQEEAGVARRLALSLVACGFRAHFVAASEAAVWPHGWAYSVRSTDTIICIGHAGHSGSGSLAEAVGAVRIVQKAADDKTASIALSAGPEGAFHADSDGSPEDAEAASEQEDDALSALEAECVVVHPSIGSVVRSNLPRSYERSVLCECACFCKLPLLNFR